MPTEGLGQTTDDIHPLRLREGGEVYDSLGMISYQGLLVTDGQGPGHCEIYPARCGYPANTTHLYNIYT